MSRRKNDIIAMKIIPTSDMLKEGQQNTSKNILPVVPFQNTSSVHHVNQSYYCYSLFPNSLQANVPEPVFNNNNYVHSSNPQALSLNTNPLALATCKKRSKSKSSPQNRKKGKTKASVESGSEERNIDYDIATIVKTLTPDKNIDSDSSASTTFMDDNSGKVNSGKKDELSLLCNEKAFSRLKTSQNFAGQHSLVNSFKKQESNLTALPFSNSSYLLPQYPSPSSSLLKEALVKNSSNMQTVASVTFNISPNIMTSVTDIKTPSVANQSIKRAQKQQKALCDAEVLKNAKNTNMPIVNVSQKVGRMNFKSVYESMGLDEDLCDVEPSVTSKSAYSYTTSSKSDSSPVNVNKLNIISPVCDFRNVPIKIERDVTPPPSSTVGSEVSGINSSLQNESVQNWSVNDMHVSMTFEEDTSYNDDFEDDLPLSFLKDRLSVDEISSPSKPPSLEANGLNNENNDIPHSLFIKKELIEDEIVSESQAVSTKNLVPVDSCVQKDSLLSSSNELETVKNLSTSLHFDSAVVNIKTEPNSEHESSEISTEITSLSFSQESPVVTVAANDKSGAKNLKNPRKSKPKNSTKITKKRRVSNNYAVQTETSLKTSSLEIKDDSDISDISSVVSSTSSRSISENTVMKNSHLESKNHLSSENNLVKAGTDLQGEFDGTDQTEFKSSNKVKASAVSAVKRNVKKGGRNNKKARSKSDAHTEIENNNQENIQTSTSEQLSNISETSSIQIHVNSESNSVTSDVISDLEKGNKKNTIKRKGKKKKRKKCDVVVDENLPLTLLIKRSKSDYGDASNSESFSYTTVSKSVSSESNLSSNENNSNVDILSSGNPRTANKKGKQAKNIDNNSCYFEISGCEQNPPQGQQKNKKTRTKRKTNTSANTSSETSTDSKMSSNNDVPSSLNISTSTDSLRNVDSAKTAESCNSHVAVEKDSNSKIQNSSEHSVAKSSNTFATEKVAIYMSFEEHSPPNEVSEDLNSVILGIKKEKDSPSSGNGSTTQSPHNSADMFSAITNIKKESDYVLDTESRTSEKSDKHSEILTSEHSLPLSSQNAQVSEICLEISTSNSNFSDVSNRPSTSNSEQMQPEPLNSKLISKKKKKRPKSYGWYKKKKSRVTPKTSVTPTEPVLANSEPAVTTAPVSVTSQDLTFAAASKMPVVIIKNLSPDIKKSLVTETEDIQYDSLPSDQSLVNLSVVNTKKERSNSKKKRSQVNKKDSSKNMSLKNTEVESNKNLEQPENPDVYSKNKLDEVSKKDSDNLAPLSTCTRLTITRSTSEETVIADPLPEHNVELSNDSHSNAGQVHTPLLNVAKIAEEIAEIESICRQKMMQNVLKGNALIESNCNSKISEMGGIKMPSESSMDSSSVIDSDFSHSSTNRTHILNSLNSDLNKTDSLTNHLSASSSLLSGISLSPHIQIKKELDSDRYSHSDSSSNLVSSILATSCNENKSKNSRRIIPPEKNSMLDKTQPVLHNSNKDSLLVSLASIKKEPRIDDNPQDQFLKNLFTSNNISRSVSDNFSANQGIDKILPRNFRNNSFSTTESQNISALSNSAIKSSQSKPPDINKITSDKIALSIKKEVCEDAKSGSLKYTSVTEIRNQNELVEKISGTLSRSEVIASSIPSSKSNIPAIPTQGISSGSPDDDEIQIIGTDIQKKKNVPCVDLTDDNLDIKHQEILSADSANAECPEMNKNRNLDAKCSLDATSNDNNSSALSENRQRIVDNNKNLDLATESDDSQNQIKLFQSKISDLTSDFDEEDMSTSDDKEIVYPTIVKDKYNREFLKHPYPPSVVSYQSKQRDKNKIYTRINCKAWNLSLCEVECRLRHSEYTTPQFGKKLGDIVKLEKYPVSSSEVECYHRILGVAPSHKLLSKCFKYPDPKVSTALNSEFDAFQKFHPSNKFEDNTRNPMPCSLNDITLNDIIQGISESKMMCNPNFKVNSELLDRDCPSADTKDSCDSHLSNFSDKLIKKKELKYQIKDNEFADFAKESSSSDRNSLLSSDVLTSQDSVKDSTGCVEIKHSGEGLDKTLGSNEILDISSPQNILNYLTLPSKEVLDSIVNNHETKSVTHVEACDKGITVPKLKTEPFYSNDQYLSNSHDHHQSVPQSDMHVESCKFEMPDSSQSMSNQGINLIDVPITELRKILEAAGSLCPELNSNENSGMWKSKATFEYNHTQSVPVVEIGSEHNVRSVKGCNADVNMHSSSFKSPEAEKLNSFSDVSGTVNGQHSIEMSSNVGNQTDCENSDDDYVDNEPIGNEVDVERDESASLKEQMDEEPVKIPQYKSRWEKIMERKSLENKEKEKVNELLLKDCFPVSTKKTLSKKSKTTEKTNLKSNKKIPEKSKEKTDKKIEKSKCSKSKDAKKEPSKASTTRKSKEKNQELATNLFVPDKPVKNSAVNKTAENGKKSENTKKDKNKKENNKKSTESSPSKRFYGNRVTNRGSFLTESRAAEFLKKIKIPKKKPSDVPKKLMNVRSEEFHSMVKSPDIDITSSSISSYNSVNKSGFNSHKRVEYCKKNSNYRSSSHVPRSQYEQNRKVPFTGTQPNLYHTSEDKNMQKRRPPLLSTPPTLSQHLNNENVLKKKTPLLSSPFHHKNDDIQNRKVLLNKPPSISSQLPVTNSFQSNKDPQKSLIECILSSIQVKPTVPEVRDQILPFSEYLHSTSNTNRHTSMNYGYEELPLQDNLSGHSNILLSESSLSVKSTSFGKDLPSSGPFNPLNSIPGLSSSSFSYQKQIDPSSDPASQILNSPPFITSASSGQVTFQTTRKASCLVPHHLKSLVGHEIIETQNVRLLMLEWSVDWLVQQQKFHDPPPISNALKKVVSSYDSFEDYYNTYFPLLLLDTWHRIYVSWTHLSQVNPYFCEITSYSVKSNYISVECQTVFNTASHPKGVFPDEGSILMVKYGTKLNEFAIKILGYVTNVKTRRFNHITDSKICGYKSPKDGNYVNVDVLQVLTLTFMGAYNSEEIDKRLPIRIHVLCNVRSTLKQNDALLYIEKSPLHGSILNPIEHGLISVALTPRNSAPEKVNECVRDITKGILSPHPLPLLTIVRAMPESDRLNIIPLLIDKMKISYKTKVLLCVRTVRALGDIAANICLRDSLKLVIINKRCDTNPHFQKYLLDELVNVEVNKAVAVASHAKNEVVMRARKQIFKECDVVLSLIRNCHDEFMEETFTETETVAQMCCIIDEANLCTEPETLIPILHGISKLILIGDPDYPAKVLSKTASSYDYNRSFFHRAYDLDLITD